MRETMCARPTASKIDFEIGSSLLSLRLFGPVCSDRGAYYPNSSLQLGSTHNRATYHLSEGSDYPSFSAFSQAAIGTGQDLLGVKEGYAFVD